MTSITSLTKECLIDFETRVKEAFLTQKIHAPIHLSGGNEAQLIDIFRDVRPQDWVFSTWRNHYHALLKGIPEEWLYQEILAGRSMYISSKEHRFLSSSIVGGILPIACGMAMGIKRLGLNERVWVFIGDMSAHTGICFETSRYARGHNLPMTVVVEDNGLSTNTPTRQVWGMDFGEQTGYGCYKYKRSYPHVGVGEFVTFG